ncbi:hypothetical protein CDD83_2138 [Cordyceps sp. RAO-2017]|nr:hypothetical protein CDD83_2138 [Cordyceps sp. RAO-2017]
MGYSNLMRSISAMKVGRAPAKYSRVKDVDDLEPASPESHDSRSSVGSSEIWKSILLVALYAPMGWKSPVEDSRAKLYGYRITLGRFRPADASNQVPKEIRVFRQNNTFTEPPNPENDRAWNELLPVSAMTCSLAFADTFRRRRNTPLIMRKPGRGFVYVENGAKYGLEPGIATDKGEIYSVSMYHQIHCLGLVRRNYWRLIHGVINGTDEVAEFARKELNGSHTAHCFDYFRQGFECSADMSLEWPLTSASGKRLQVDGDGIPHVCASKVSKAYLTLVPNSIQWL